MDNQNENFPLNSFELFRVLEVKNLGNFSFGFSLNNFFLIIFQNYSDSETE